MLTFETKNVKLKKIRIRKKRVIFEKKYCVFALISMSTRILKISRVYVRK